MYGSSSTEPIQKEVMDPGTKKAALKRRLAGKPKVIPDDPSAEPKQDDPIAALIQKRKRGF